MLDLIKVEQIDNKVMMPKEDFERMVADLDSLTETVEILSDRDLMEQIRQSEKEIREGKVNQIKKGY